MRDAFIKTLEEEAEKNKEIVLLTGDLGFSVFESFQKKFPDRFFNCGIAEQNMMGLAAGLSLSGKKVFVYSIIPFVTLRCIEQIKNDICYHNLSVVIVGVGSGLSYGSSGFTHHATEDIGCLKSLPNLTILSPSDPNEVAAFIKESASYNHPIYLRLGKNNEQRFNNSPKIAIGEVYQLTSGKDIAVITHGNIIEEVFKAHKILEEKGISSSIISSPTIKPLNREYFKQIFKDHRKIFVVEEHNRIGGLGDSLSSLNLGNITNIAINDRFINEAGDKDYLREKEHINAQSILDKIITTLKNEN